MFKRKRSGPSTDPWGTPKVMDTSVEDYSPNTSFHDFLLAFVSSERYMEELCITLIFLTETNFLTVSYLPISIPELNAVLKAFQISSSVLSWKQIFLKIFPA